MNGLEHIQDSALTELSEAAFAQLGCVDHGVVVLHGARSWGAHERGSIELPLKDGSVVVPIAYDERNAPFAVDAQGNEVGDLLLSLTDEDDYLACAWARVQPSSDLVGVGVDLCSTVRFCERQGKRDLGRLLLTEHERELASALVPHDDALGKATLFAAKEASFKALAAPLRTWYQRESDELLYELRHFVMDRPGHELGTGRNGAAQAAMDRMQIQELRVHHAELHDLAIVVATAQKHPCPR